MVILSLFTFHEDDSNRGGQLFAIAKSCCQKCSLNDQWYHLPAMKREKSVTKPNLIFPEMQCRDCAQVHAH